MSEKLSRQYVKAGSVENYVSDLLDKKLSFSVRRASECTEIILDDKHIVFASQNNFPKKKIYLFNNVKQQVTKWLKNNFVILPDDVHSITYNYDYDTEFFPDKLGQALEICCALRAYQSHMKIVKGSSLSNATNHIGYSWEGKAHRALADTRACRSVWRWLLEQDPEIEHTHSYL